MKKTHIAIILGVMCFLLTIGICVQLKTIKNTTSAFGRTQTENELRDSVSRYQQRYKSTYENLEKAEKRLDELREQAAKDDNASQDRAKELTNYENFLGRSELIGPGVTITLKDGEVSNNNPFFTDVIVHDGDILQIINALRNAGAEAISVNGQRIVNNSSVTCIGNVIKINGEKVGTPFVINAIGSPSLLYGSITIKGGYLDILKSAGVQVKATQVEKDSIVIPKYEGVYKFEYATRDE